jgi:hypothetical protein
MSKYVLDTVITCLVTLYLKRQIGLFRCQLYFGILILDCLDQYSLIFALLL